MLTVYQAATNGALNGERVYQFMDHLGSIEVLTDQNANITQGSSFDAWGERRQYNGVAMDQLAQMAANTRKTRRGFTGHEQVDSVNIIHMNGRIYDPKLGRFPQRRQRQPSLNRYSLRIEEQSIFQLGLANTKGRMLQNIIFAIFSRLGV